MSPPPVCPCDPPAADGSHGPPAHLPPHPPCPALAPRPLRPGCPALPLLPEPTAELAKASLGVAFSLLLRLRALPGGGHRPLGAGEVFLLGLGFLYQY